MGTAELQDLREQIDRIDQEIIALLSERFKITEEVGIYKAEHALPVQDINREAEQFGKIAELSMSRGLRPEYAVGVYRCIIDLVISRHREIKEERK